MPLTIRGDDARGADRDPLRVVVLLARWHRDVTDGLLAGALAALERAGIKDDRVTVVEVPGSFELPAAAAAVARSGKADAIVALGCIVKGETRHDEVIAAACAKGLVDVSAATGVPVGFGVITADTYEQAVARSDPRNEGRGKKGNKGREAAEAAVTLARTLDRYGGAP